MTFTICLRIWPWIGKRTLFKGSAHIEYMRGIRNPVGIKIGADMAPSDLLSLLRNLNPLNDPGRVVIITRMGVAKIENSFAGAY